MNRCCDWNYTKAVFARHPFHNRGASWSCRYADSHSIYGFFLLSFKLFFVCFYFNKHFTAESGWGNTYEK